MSYSDTDNPNQILKTSKSRTNREEIGYNCRKEDDKKDRKIVFISANNSAKITKKIVLVQTNQIRNNKSKNWVCR